MSNQENSSQSQTEHAPDPMNLEGAQPDPMLQMSAGTLGAGGITLVAVVIAFVVAVVLYGLNGPSANERGNQPAPPQASAAASSAHHG